MLLYVQFTKELTLPLRFRFSDLMTVQTLTLPPTLNLTLYIGLSGLSKCFHGVPLAKTLTAIFPLRDSAQRLASILTLS